MWIKKNFFYKWNEIIKYNKIQKKKKKNKGNDNKNKKITMN